MKAEETNFFFLCIAPKIGLFVKQVCLLVSYIQDSVRGTKECQDTDVELFSKVLQQERGVRRLAEAGQKKIAKMSVSVQGSNTVKGKDSLMLSSVLTITPTRTEA